MTPLAAHFIKQQTLPIKRRDVIHDPDRMLSRMADIHCFDITEIKDVVHQVVDAWEDKGEPIDTCRDRIFLPAPNTWIEWNGDADGNRGATFLSDCGDGWADAYAVSPQGHGGTYYVWKCERLCLSDTAVYRPDGVRYEGASWLRATLALINTPRIVGRRQHMPNKGLERRLTQHFGVGKFPLHAWTEIKLEVLKPIEIDDGAPHEAHLTGKRALHFCRAHIRIRMGKLEYVTSHWRGDPAIGIKQSRYVVTK